MQTLSFSVASRTRGYLPPQVVNIAREDGMSPHFALVGRHGQLVSAGERHVPLSTVSMTIVAATSAPRGTPIVVPGAALVLALFLSSDVVLPPPA